MIHVCFGLYDKTGRYSKFTGTAMLSMFENTSSKVTVHILHDNTLSSENRDKFSYVAGQCNQLVKFYNVDKLCADRINKISDMLPALKTHWGSIGTFYRFMIRDIIPREAEKIIYLDSDVIVNLDIAELWRVELGDKVLGVVPEILNGCDVKNQFPLVADGLVKFDGYFNAGVLLMNLNVLRGEEDTLFGGIKFILENPRYQRYMDQDIFNYYFSAHSLKLPVKFNRFVSSAQAEPNPKAERKIYHYVPKPKAMQIYMNDPFNRLWMSYFVRTPWFDAETIGRLYAGFEQVHVALKRSLVKVSAIMSGKTRAFFDAAQNVEALKKMFSLQKGEEIITIENDGLQKLLNAMKKARGKKIFFIMVPNFPYQVLVEAGFVFGKDFLNGMDFLSEAQGVPLNSYPLIKMM